MLKTNVVVVTKGGAGSGFEGHAGRPGKVGGSAPSGTSHGLQVSDSFTGEIGMRAVVMNGKVYEGIEAMNGKVYEDIEAMGAYHTQIFARMVLDGLVPNSSLLETQSQLIVDTREPENSELESRVMALTDAYSVEIQREHFFRNATRKLLFVQDKYPPEGTISEGINKLFKRVQRDIQRGIIDVPNVSSIGINYSVAFVEIPIYEIDNIANIILSDLGHTFRYKQIVVTKGGAAMLLNQEMPPSTGTSRQSQGRTIVVKGGTGSGDYGHAGRPGQIGGSAPSGAIVVHHPSTRLARVRFGKKFSKENLEDVKDSPWHGAFRSNVAHVKNDGDVILKYKETIHGFSKDLTSDYTGEVEAYRTAEQLGFKDLVPRTERTRNPVTDEKCSAQKLVTKDTEKVANTQVFHDLPVDQFSQLAVLDMITGNQDRHGNNLLVNQKTGQIYAIDNGLAFMDNPGYHDDGLEAAKEHYYSVTFKHDFKVLPEHIAAGERLVHNASWRKRIRQKFHSRKTLDKIDSRWSSFVATCTAKGWWSDSIAERFVSESTSSSDSGPSSPYGIWNQ